MFKRLFLKVNSFFDNYSYNNSLKNEYNNSLNNGYNNLCGYNLKTFNFILFLDCSLKTIDFWNLLVRVMVHVKLMMWEDYKKSFCLYSITSVL
jgi:hypothetical protein